MSRPEDFKFDPYTGESWASSVPIQADTYRSLYPKRVFWTNPWTGVKRDMGDVNGNPYMENVAAPADPRGVLRAKQAAASSAPAFPPCQGRNCGATDGVSHSPECKIEHEAAVLGVGIRFLEPARKREPYKAIMSLDECCAAEGAQPGAIQFAGPEPAEADPTGRGAHDAGAKMDAGKPRVWLCVSGFSNALFAVADVTTRGAEKYAPNSWMSVPDGAERYMEGFARHALALGRGETHDTGPGGTGCLHKAQMIWNLLASLELEMRNDAGWSRGS